MGENTYSNPRTWIIRILFILMAVVLIIRLVTLQLIEDKYKTLADDQAIFRKVIYPARGEMFDRKGRNLLVNNIAFDLVVTPSKIKNFDTATFCDVMQITPEQFNSTIEKLILKNTKQRASVFEANLSVA